MDAIDHLRRSSYRWALAGFRLDRGDCLDSVLAALLDALFLLHDPADCLFLGEDPSCAVEYELVASRIWERLVLHHGEHGEFVDQQCRAIVFEEMEREFEAAPLHDWQFCEIMGREFGVEVRPAPPSVTRPDHQVSERAFHEPVHPPHAVVGFVDELMRRLGGIGGFER
jgi:hypothetical protein